MSREKVLGEKDDHRHLTPADQFFAGVLLGGNGIEHPFGNVPVAVITLFISFPF
jgi:hypothetical protein